MRPSEFARLVSHVIVLSCVLCTGCQSPSTPAQSQPVTGGISLCTELLNPALKMRVASINLESLSKQYRERLFATEDSTRTDKQSGDLGFRAGDIDLSLDGSNAAVATVRKRFEANRNYRLEWQDVQDVLVDRAEAAQFTAFIECIKGCGVTVKAAERAPDLIEFDVQWVQPRGAWIDPPIVADIAISDGSTLNPHHVLKIGQPIPHPGVSKLMVTRDPAKTTLLQVHTALESASDFVPGYPPKNGAPRCIPCREPISDEVISISDDPGRWWGHNGNETIDCKVPVGGRITSLAVRSDHRIHSIVVKYRDASGGVHSTRFGRDVDDGVRETTIDLDEDEWITRIDWIDSNNPVTPLVDQMVVYTNKGDIVPVGDGLWETGSMATYVYEPGPYNCVLVDIGVTHDRTRGGGINSGRGHYQIKRGVRKPE